MSHRRLFDIVFLFVFSTYSRRLKRGTVQSFVALSRKDLGELVEIDVRFNGIPYVSRWHLVSAVVKPGWKNQE